jgi:hypothetical protein
MGKNVLNELRIRMCARACVAVVVFVCVIGLVANCTAAGFQLQARSQFIEAAAACINGSIPLAAQDIIHAERATIGRADYAASVQNMCEVVALCLVMLAFLFVGPLCLYIIFKARVYCDNALRRAHAVVDRESISRTRGSAGVSAQKSITLLRNILNSSSAQRRRITATFVVVLATFFPRIVLDVLQVIGNYAVKDVSCDACGTCQGQAWLIQEWMNNMAVYQVVVVMLSSPLPQTIALWGMLSKEHIGILRRGYDRVTLPGSVNLIAERGSALGIARAGMHIDLPLQGTSAPLLQAR